MTKEELKAKIDLCVAQQGNQSGLAGLAEILNELVEQGGGGGGSQTIELTGLPDTSMTTLEELAAIGLTPEIIADAAKGKYAGAHISLGGAADMFCYIIAVAANNLLGIGMFFGTTTDIGPGVAGIFTSINGDTVIVDTIE